jgi:hypothetical protein
MGKGGELEMPLGPLVMGTGTGLWVAARCLLLLGVVDVLCVVAAVADVRVCASDVMCCVLGVAALIYMRYL